MPRRGCYSVADARFGRWVSDNLSETHGKAIYRACQLWQVFGETRARGADGQLNAAAVIRLSTTRTPATDFEQRTR